MTAFFLKKLLPIAIGAVGLWLAGRYLLPVALPFLLGAGMAWLSEPVVKTLSHKTSRTLGTAVGVSLTLGVLVGVVVLVGAMTVRQMGRLTKSIPQLAEGARESLSAVGSWLSSLTQKAPTQLQPMLQRTTEEFFSDGTVVIDQLTQRLPGAVTTAIGKVGNGALGLGTGVLSAFLISARLPKLRQWLANYEPLQQTKRFLLPVRTALGGWLKAQLKLCALTFGILSIGFLVLGIRGGIAWAAVVALVDAVPILGTGTVLVPWAAVCLLQGQSLRAIGLLCTYGAALLTRTALEPRLVGDQLGLDPLMTLAALYVGYRFWGFGGLLLTPIFASAVFSLYKAKKQL